MAQDYVLEDTDISIVEDLPPPRKKHKSDSAVLREQVSTSTTNVRDILCLLLALQINQKYHAALQQHNQANESIIEWFDRSVNDELEKHRLQADYPLETMTISQGIRHPQVIESTASCVEILGNLQSTPDTELSEAVDKFARAEAMVAFEGAVLAAESAAANAPPELAEEAAAAGAKGYQAELTSVVNRSVPGLKPIEVIGYVGITKPRHPLPPKDLTLIQSLK